MTPLEKIEWISGVAINHQISGSATKVAVYLMHCENHKTGQLNPGDSLIISATGVSRASVIRGMKSLVEQGHIEIKTKGNGKGKKTDYRLVQRVSKKYPFSDPKGIKIRPERVSKKYPFSDPKGIKIVRKGYQKRQEPCPTPFRGTSEGTSECAPRKKNDTENKILAAEKKPEKTPDEIGVGIIDYLNIKAGRKYRPVESNLRLLRARLKEGHTKENIEAVIDRKTIEWINDPKMDQFLRPSTLFGAEKFNQYVGQLDSPMPSNNDCSEQRAVNNRAAAEEFLNEKIINTPQGNVIDGEFTEIRNAAAR